MGSVDLIDVSKHFTLRVDGVQQTVAALSHLNFSVSDGEIVALIGPSGCGKTTALRIAMGLEAASGGQVVDGLIECPWHGSRFELATGRRRRGPTAYDQPAYEVRVAEGGGYEARRTS